MSTQSSKALTPAEKRKITLAAKAERERQEQSAFVAESKAVGGRKAKVDAKEKAIWKVDQPVSHKRTSSTAQVSETAKKARGTKDTSVPSEDEDAPEIPAASKVKASGRKYPAPKIDVDSDGSEPETTNLGVFLFLSHDSPLSHPVHIDFTNLPQYKAKSTGTKVKTAVSKGFKVLARGVKSAVKKTSATEIIKPTKPTTKKVAVTAPARIVAESASEEEAVSSDKHSDKVTSDQSDAEDISPNEDKFRTEVPRVIAAKKSKVIQEDSGDESDADIEMQHVKGKQRARGSAQDLFESHNESNEIDKPHMNKVSKSRQERYEPDSDDTFSDAPKRVLDGDSDIEMPPPKRSIHSRRSSTSSWPSGCDLHVPDSDADDAEEQQTTKPTLKKKKSAAPPKDYGSDMEFHEAIAKGPTTVPHDAEEEQTTKHALKKKKSAAPPKDYGSDMEFHEAIAKGLTTVPHNIHSRRSSAASSWNLRVADSDADDSVNEAAGPSLKKKSRKVSAARQKQADMETPEVRSVPSRPDPWKLSKGLTTQLDRIAAASVDAASRPEDSWPISARIMFPAPGKDIGLTDQGEELKAVLRGCIEFIKLSLLFEDSYPAIVSRAGFARAYLISAAQLPASVHIKNRLETDLSFGTRLADIPLDRINILRGDLKRLAAQEVPGLFKFALVPAAEAKTIVTGRIQDHRYIFPVDPTTGRLKAELPFRHESIVSILKKGVFTNTQFKTKNLHLFASTSTKHPHRLELPDAMVCLAATAVYGALVEYQATGNHQKIPFTEGAYEDTYRNHMKTLSDTHASAPVALHKVLHALFNLVTDTTAVQATVGSSSVLINLVEIPESD
ncbi:hypothetical protein B0H10DRAFT_2241418 [Mycena sp. CBHHK59/15]|nr:hypothetical protein B0H10DRAFT_2241418 [Mycena sp. CBHHK59/15]